MYRAIIGGSKTLCLIADESRLPKKTLEKYSWEAFDSHSHDSCGPLPDDLFLLLQSLVMATHEKDIEAAQALQGELWPLLSAEQNHLLHLVLQEAVCPSGQGI